MGRHTGRPELGFVLLAVLVILLIIGSTSASFISFMNRQQTWSGTRYHSAAALGLAEAGVHRALAILETTAPDRKSRGRDWRPAAYTEERAVGPMTGRVTLSLADGRDGTIIVTSTGDVGGQIRRVRARVHLASPALLVALYGSSFVRTENAPGAMVILPYSSGIGEWPWIHIAAGRELWFATNGVSINDPSVWFEAGPGPADAPDAASAATRPHPATPARLLLARGAELTVGQDRQPADLQQLQALGISVKGTVLRTETLPALPLIDRVYYQARARANASNASLNRAAGRFAGDATLTEKRDSLYSAGEWTTVQAFLRAGGQPPRLAGVIYVLGGVSLGDGESVQIADGALVTDGPVHLGAEASLQVTHTAATRTLPGLLALEQGDLIVASRARLRVHGLVYADRVFGIGAGARLDIVGAVMAAGQDMSFRSDAASVVIRYDPAVMGTPGLRVPADAPVIAWIGAWEEIP